MAMTSLIHVYSDSLATVRCSSSENIRLTAEVNAITKTQKYTREQRSKITFRLKQIRDELLKRIKVDDVPSCPDFAEVS